MKNNRSTLHFIHQGIGKKRILIFVLLVVKGLLGAGDVLYAVFLRGIVDGAVRGYKYSFIRNALFLIILVAIQIILRSINRHLEENAKASYENCFKKRMFAALMRKDFKKVEAVHTAEWMNRMTSDTIVVSEGLVTIIPGIAGMFVKMVGAIIAIIFMEPILGSLLMVAGVLLILFSYFFRKTIKRLHKKVQEADGSVRVFLQERLENLIVVHSFAKENQSITDAEERMKEHKTARMEKNYFSNICNAGFGIAMNGAKVFSVVYCGYKILTKTMSYGSFIAITQLIGQIQAPFANISGFVPKYFSMLASAERLMEFEKIEETAGVNDEVLDITQVKKIYDEDIISLKMENISFSYENKKVIDKLTFEIVKGEYVAITGFSGCGKSTLLKLLLNLYLPEGGEYYMNLRNDKKVKLENKYKKLFAYVPQGNQLMSGTIRQIVTFEDEKFSKETERIDSVLKIACADEFVEKLPEGIDTVLGEKGAGLSEGQMQRLAIARAIFSESPILIFDEATSSLDENTEFRLLENLKQMTNKTVLIVTHRKAVLKICEKEIRLGE